MARKVCTVGVDVGGTTMNFGLVTPEGKLLHNFERDTEGHLGPERVMANIVRYLEEIIGQADGYEVNGIGLGSPGAIDTARGYVVYCAPNIPNWTGMYICDPIRRRFGLPTFVDNDAKVAVVGEATYGAGAGMRHVFVVTLGTGIGGGVVLDGRIHRGAFYCAGEIGHAAVQARGRRCPCGIEGHLEAYISAKGLIGQVTEALSAGRESLVSRELSGGKLSWLNSRMIFEAAAKGDALCKEVIDSSFHYLGMALAHFAMVFDPELIVLAGGIAQAGRLVFDPTNEAYDRYLFYRDIRRAPIVPARLGPEAGLVGAAAMAMIELGLDAPVRPGPAAT